MSVPIEFHLDNLKISQDLRDKVTQHCDKWTEGHHDISNIYFSVKQVSGKKSVHEYEAKVVLYHRPDHIVVTHRSPGIPEVVTAVIHSVERRIRETRKQYRDKRKRARTDIAPE
jgi:ribosome-associated translation inhibitor RaiA